MKSILKEPIQRKIFLLAVVFIATFVVLVVSEGFMARLSRERESAIHNQRARRTIGKVILRKLISIELGFGKLATTTDRRDVGALDKEITSSVSNIESALSVLRNGGDYEDILPANFGDVNEIREHMSFRRDKEKGYVVEVIELTPRVLDIKCTCISLVKAVNRNLGAPNDSERDASRKQIDLLQKQAHAIILRSRESADRVFYDTNLEIQHLEREQAESIRLFATVRYVIIVTFGLGGIGICVLVIRRIGRIVEERKWAEQEVARHRNHLAQLVEERTADLTKANKGLVAEIDERKRAEEALRTERDKLQVLMTGLADMGIGIDIVGTDHKILFQNQTREERFGDLVGKACYEGYMGRDKPCDACPMLKAVDSGNTEVAEVATPDGRQYEVVAAPLINAEGIVDSVVEVVRDITNRKHAEEQIAIFRQFADTSGQGFGIATLDGKLTYVNVPFCRILGENSPEDAIGKYFVSYYHQEIQQRLHNEILPVVIRGEQWVGELDTVSNRGEIIPTITNFFVIRNQDDEPLYYAGVFSDITDRKRAEEELRAAQAEVELLLATIPSIMIGLDHNGLVTLWNRPAEKIFGINADNVVGQVFRELKIDWEWEEVTRQIDLCREKDVETRVDELTFKAPDGSEHILAMKINQVVESSGKVTGVLISGADISERRSLEKQLGQAQKLESVGQLAAGIAHEINTPTQYVGDNTRFLHESFGDLKDAIEKCREFLTSGKDVTPETLGPIQEAFEAADVEYLMDEIPRAIEQSLEGIERVTRIVRAMKSFSHPGTEAKTATDLNNLIENTVTVCRNEWKYVSDLTMNLDEGLPPVYCLPGELNQVILNLIMNASQAIQELIGESPEQKGAITVETKLNGKWVETRIGDSGGGIPEKIASKVFDLFFTTKEAGKGTGQGLSIARDVVVMKHSGSIDFETQAGEGTTFIIRLPIRPPEMVEDNKVKEAANAA